MVALHFTTMSGDDGRHNDASQPILDITTRTRFRRCTLRAIYTFGRLTRRRPRRENSRMSQPNQVSAHRPRRRWYQYSLRTLLGLVTLAVAAVMVWRIYHPEPRRNE